mgnify:CR=1 FL=1
MPYGAKGSIVGKMLKPKANPAEVVSPSNEIEVAEVEEGAEGHEGAVALYENALQDLQQLAELVPEVGNVARRLEALWDAVKEADGAVEEPEAEGVAEPVPEDLGKPPARVGAGGVARLIG